MYVGWDWATETHAITVLDAQGGSVDRWSCRHDEVGLTSTLERLGRYGAPAELPVAIERADGLVVDRLLAAGHPVVPIHPNAFHAARPRWGAARAKSDPGDSAKLADYLRTDGHRLRRLQPLAPAARQLQLLVRTREDHLAARIAATNQFARAAGHLLARRQGHLCRSGLGDRAEVPGTLPHAGGRRPPG